MRFNAVIAAYILAATVSGAALPVAEDSTAEVAAPATPVEPEMSGEGYYVPEDFPEDLDPEDYEFTFEENAKRSADPTPLPKQDGPGAHTSLLACPLANAMQRLKLDGPGALTGLLVCPLESARPSFPHNFTTSIHQKIRLPII